MPGGFYAPLEVSQHWPVPNYENPQLRPNTILILSYILGPLTVALCLVRIWVRVYHQKSAGVDDWLMLAAIPLTITLTVLYPLTEKQAFDRHIWDLDVFTDPQRVVVARKYILATEVIFCAVTGLVKVSILLFYRRLSARVVSKTFFWTTWISIGYIIAYTIALCIAPIVGCQPISAFWDQFDTIKIVQGYEFHCFDEGADVLVASIISVTQDLLTAVLPTFLYWNLTIPLRQKMALFGIFAMGYGVVALGALRSYYSWHAFYNTYDVTWATWDLLMTALLELHIGCLCANAPALKVFFKHFFQEKLTSRSRTKTPVDSKDGGVTPSCSSKPSKSSKSSVWSKLTLLLDTQSQSGTRSTKGYLDSHAGTAVDPHGGVHVQKGLQVQHSPTNCQPEIHVERPISAMTTDNIVDHYYDDIELGLYTTRNSGTSSAYSPHDFDSAVPGTIPPLPASPSAAPPHEPLAAHPVSPIIPQRPNSLLPVASVGEHGTLPRSATPIPLQTSSQHRPSWQSWS